MVSIPTLHYGMPLSELELKHLSHKITPKSNVLGRPYIGFLTETSHQIKSSNLLDMSFEQNAVHKKNRRPIANRTVKGLAFKNNEYAEKQNRLKHELYSRKMLEGISPSGSKTSPVFKVLLNQVKYVRKYRPKTIGIKQLKSSLYQIELPEGFQPESRSIVRLKTTEYCNSQYKLYSYQANPVHSQPKKIDLVNLCIGANIPMFNTRYGNEFHPRRQTQSYFHRRMSGTGGLLRRSQEKQMARSIQIAVTEMKLFRKTNARKIDGGFYKRLKKVVEQRLMTYSDSNPRHRSHSLGQNRIRVPRQTPRNNRQHSDRHLSPWDNSAYDVFIF